MYHSRIPNNDLRVVEGFKFSRKESHKFISFLFPRGYHPQKKNYNLQTCFIYLKISYYRKLNKTTIK